MDAAARAPCAAIVAVVCSSGGLTRPCGGKTAGCERSSNLGMSLLSFEKDHGGTSGGDVGSTIGTSATVS